VIDSISSAEVKLQTLRRRIISVPQEFVHLPGSVRLNMDPFEQCTDTQIEFALQKVKLLGKVNSDGGIASDFEPGNYSTGEKQLLSLARAVLQRKAQGTSLIVMDEATSHLDEETEGLMHQLFIEELCGCTIISVAHRPAFTEAADMVVFMDSGKIDEIAKPKS
jgi:ATP-binding cassette, subfamily C (CFTR/MRP), member 1